MKIEIISNDNGNGMNELLTVWGDYNPKNKVFYKRLCNIETDDFIECFPVHQQDNIIKKLYSGVFVFDVIKDILLEKAKRIF